ncbi:MAG: diguanylate cyclase [Methylophilaceae bacterium]
MKNNKSPADIARQTLMQLAKRSLPPTPENYANAYEEIAGTKAVDAPSVNKTLQKVLAVASKKNSAFVATEKSINVAVKKQDWPALEKQFQKLLINNVEGSASDVNWSVLIRTLLRQLETSHKGVTLSRKKEGLSRVLAHFAKDPSALADKIQALMRSWGNSASETEALNIASNLHATKKASTETAKVQKDDSNVGVAAHNDKAVEQLLEMMTRTLDLALIPLLETAPDAQKKAKNLLSQLSKKTSEKTLEKNARTLNSILLFSETERENQESIKQSLVDLLRLTSASMTELVGDDEWLTSQIEIVNDVLSNPVTTITLQNAEYSLKELIHKQSNLKPAMHDAKELLKEMAATFITRLVDITESTDDYHHKIESHQEMLGDINDIDELNSVLKNVLDDTKTIGLTVQRTREEFNESQDKITKAEHKIQELTSVLEYINEVANEDYLTGTLNRRGMDEALEREFSRADRHNTELSIAMMDIDHFKKLNDALGHSTGDEALTHFARVIKDVKRTTDVLARYGGEEFIIILPNTAQDDGIKVIERVQRELTKKIFMHSDERVVITFSAGVAQRQENEAPEDIIPRADAALYEAKNSGRNRVNGAPMDNVDNSNPKAITPPEATSKEIRH